MSLVKYRVKEVAADFGKTPKDIAEIVGKYFEKPRSNTQVLTDEQLNHLVYDKVEPDLLWIRMNGSIVGSGIGLVIFILLQLVP